MTGAHYVAFTESLQNCVAVTILGVLKVFHTMIYYYIYIYNVLISAALEHC